MINPAALGLKFCKPCGEWLPATTEFFCPNRRTGFLRSHCKPCRSRMAMEWHRDNREVHLESLREYNRTNKVEIAALAHAYYERNRHKVIERTRKWAQDNPEAVAKFSREKEQRRRAAMYAVDYEYVDRAVVYDRDGGMCGICHEMVDYKDFHVDHVFPLSKGGSHTYDNVQVAHPSCNLMKSAKVDFVYQERM